MWYNRWVDTVWRGETGMAVFWEQLLALVAVVFIAFGTVYGYRSWRRNKMR